MSFNTSRQLILDIKAQDRLREWFAKRGNPNNVVITCLSLGDSDIDYELSDQVDKIQVLSAPYNIERIKTKLIYEGNMSNLTGKITSYLRYVNANGKLNSLYNYVPSKVFLLGVFPPTLSNGFDWDSITFTSSLREGFVIYFQTLPDGFTEPDPSDNTKTRPLRFEEKYEITYTNFPSPNQIVGAITGATVIITVANAINNLDSYQLVNSSEVVISGVNGLNGANGRYYTKPTSFNTFEIYYDSALTLPVPSSGTYVFSGSTNKWISTFDSSNGSLLITHGAFPLLGATNGLVKVRGLKTGITKEINFNY